EIMKTSHFIRQMIKRISFDVVEQIKKIDDLRQHNEELLNIYNESEDDTTYQVCNTQLNGLIDLMNYQYGLLGEMLNNSEVK
ncbi:MAG: hypothetical protein VW518_10880, partial [Burkholderiaceae bacterium]